MSKYIVLILGILIIGCSAIASLQPIQVEYDKFDNSTKFKTSKIVLNETFVFPSVLRAHAYKICEGNMVNCDPEEISMFFTSVSKDWRYVQYPAIELTFIADGEIINPGYASLIGTNILTTGGVQVQEFIGISIDKSIFMKIAFADTLEGKLGIVKFKVNYDKRDIWRALVNPFVMDKYIKK